MVHKNLFFLSLFFVFSSLLVQIFLFFHFGIDYGSALLKELYLILEVGWYLTRHYQLVLIFPELNVILFRVFRGNQGLNEPVD
jgi:hypothetical protein